MADLDVLARGRTAYARHDWGDAYATLSQADAANALDGDDLWSLAISAYMVGRDDEFHAALERGHHACFADGDSVSAARWAIWLGFHLAAKGEMGPASGWLARAQRVVERSGRACVEQGWLLLPLALRQRVSGDCAAAHDTAADAVAIGERFADPDLVAWARHEQGRALVRRGLVDDGLALLDEAMISVIAGECSPLVTGQIYCSVIEGCREVYEIRRAGEWTAELARWCERQPGLVTYAGQCLVHRCEIMLWRGRWQDALGEARRAGERFSQGSAQPAAAAAWYEQAEVHRLCGEFDAADDAYAKASRWGAEPLPGLALLRQAQGRTDAAAAALRRAVDESGDRLWRARMLPAYVEIMVAVGDTESARAARDDLDAIADEFGTDVLAAMAAQASGRLNLAEGDARRALERLRSAWQIWHDAGAPYEAARVRELIGLACRSLGDEDGADLALDAARSGFEELGAAPDLVRVDELIRGARPASDHPLTRRELQVLRLIAGGATNKTIATELFLSERTVERHVSNILTKLDVATRTAATAYAYEHGLI